MHSTRGHSGRLNVVALAGITLVWALGCQSGPQDISASFPYAAQVGSRYRVDTNELTAYGVYHSLNDRRAANVVELKYFADGSSIAGPEIAFTKKVPPGTVLRVASAWRRMGSVYYRVDVQGWELPLGVPVELAMSDLSSQLFSKIE